MTSPTTSLFTPSGTHKALNTSAAGFAVFALTSLGAVLTGHLAPSEFIAAISVSSGGLVAALVAKVVHTAAGRKVTLEAKRLEAADPSLAVDVQKTVDEAAATAAKRFEPVLAHAETVAQQVLAAHGSIVGDVVSKVREELAALPAAEQDRVDKILAAVETAAKHYLAPDLGAALVQSVKDGFAQAAAVPSGPSPDPATKAAATPAKAAPAPAPEKAAAKK